MGVVTRKRAATTAEEPVPEALAKRARTNSAAAAPVSPIGSAGTDTVPAGSPGPTPVKQRVTSVPKKGSRGAAFLAAAGIPMPSASPFPASTSPPKLSAKKDSTVKLAQLCGGLAATVPTGLPPSAAKRRNPLLDQALPKKLTTLVDMFAGLLTVHDMMRKRGQRTTYTNMRQAVEEASGRRFLLSHVAQLRHLLPETVVVEWVRLPVAARSTRTEPHLLITLDLAAAAQAAANSGAVHTIAGAGSEMHAARQLLHCRLAEHMLGAYLTHLATRAAQLQEAGDEAAAGQVEVEAKAAAKPPVFRFMAPFPEEVADVPQQALPPKPEAPTPASRGNSPAFMGRAAAAVAAVAQQLAVPLTPATTGTKPPPSSSRHGLPPVHPDTVERQRMMLRRLSFSQSGAAGAAAGAASQVTPSRAALAAATGWGLATRHVTKPATPLDKLHSEVEKQAQQQKRQGQEQPSCAAKGLQEQEEGCTAAAANIVGAQQVHPKQAELAASLDPQALEFNGSILSEEDATLLASMPPELRRMSADGILSLDSLRMLDAAEREHRRFSGKEAQQRRETNAALGELPRTFSRLQRIFGAQGPNTLKLREVVQRIKHGAELFSEAQIEQQLRALAEHAPEFVTLKPYGRCGTPAVWIKRACNGNAIMMRLKQVASARLQPREGEAA